MSKLNSSNAKSHDSKMMKDV